MWGSAVKAASPHWRGADVAVDLNHARMEEAAISTAGAAIRRHRTTHLAETSADSGLTEHAGRLMQTFEFLSADLGLEDRAGSLNADNGW